MYPDEQVGVLDPARSKAFDANASRSDTLDDFKAEVLRAIRGAMTQQTIQALIAQTVPCAPVEDEDAPID